MWFVGLIIIFIIILSSSNYDLSSIDYNNWPILHLDSNLTLFYNNEKEKEVAEYFQTKLMGNIQCFFDIILTSIFIGCNVALTNEILNKPGFSGIYINIFLGIFDIYSLVSLIIKARFDYNGKQCLNFLFDTWNNFDKVINSFIRITSLTIKKIFLDEEKEKNKERDNYRKLRFAFNFYFWIFILVCFSFASILGVQTLIFMKCSIVQVLIFSYFSNVLFIDFFLTFGFIFLLPLTILPFQYLTCSFFFFLFYLKDKILLSFKKKQKFESEDEGILDKKNSQMIMNSQVEENLLPGSESKEEKESKVVEESKAEEDLNSEESVVQIISEGRPKNNILSESQLKSQKELVIDLESEELNKKKQFERESKALSEFNLVIESEELRKDNSKLKLASNSLTESIKIESEKLDVNNILSSDDEEEKNLDDSKPASLFTIITFPLIFFALFSKLQYTYPLLVSADHEKDPSVKIAFGLPFLSLSYYTQLIEKLPTKIEQALGKMRLMLKFIDSLL